MIQPWIVAAILPLTPQVQTPGTWNEAPAAPERSWEGAAIVATDADTVYLVCGVPSNYPGAGTSCYRLTVSTGLWEAVIGVPASVGPGASMAYRPVAGTMGELYLLSGFGTDGFYRRALADVDAPWETLEPFSDGAGNALRADAGTCLAAEPDGRVFALTGVNPTGTPGNPPNSLFVAYSPGAPGAPGAWERLADTPDPQTDGGSLAHPWGIPRLYGVQGGQNSKWWTFDLAPSSPGFEQWKPGSAPFPSTYLGKTSLAAAGSSSNLYCFTTAGWIDRMFKLDAGGPGGSWTQLSSAWTATFGGSPQRLAAFDAMDTALLLRQQGTVDLWRYTLSAHQFAGLPKYGLPMGAGAAMTGVNNGTDLYVLPGNGHDAFLKYSTDTGHWTYLGYLPIPSEGPVSSLAFDGNDKIYAAIGSSDVVMFPFIHIVYFTDLWSTTLSGGQNGTFQWTHEGPVPDILVNGGSMVSAGDSLYAWRGGDSDLGWRCFTGSSWSSITAAPEALHAGGASAYDGKDLIYVLQGGTPALWAYSVSQQAWNRRTDNSTYDPADLPIGPDGFQEVPGVGASLCYPGTGPYLFALVGDGIVGARFARYDMVVDAWEWMQDVPATAGAGGVLASPGGSGAFSLFAIPGGQADRMLSYQIERDAAPMIQPSGLGQFRLDGATPIPTGGATAQSSFIVRSPVLSGYAEGAYLAVELQESGHGFTGTPTATSPAAVPCGQVAEVVVPGLVAGISYEWRAWGIDGGDPLLTSDPTGLNGSPDLIARDNQAPAIQWVAQIDASTGAPVPVGQWFLPGLNVLFRAGVADGDGDPVQLQVEVDQGGQTTSHTSSWGPSAGTVEIAVPFPDGGQVRWKARAGDDWDAMSAWQDPTGGGMAFGIFREGSTNTFSASCSAVPARSDGAWPAVTLLLMVAPILLVRRSGVRIAAVVLLLPALPRGEAATAGPNPPTPVTDLAITDYYVLPDGISTSIHLRWSVPSYASSPVSGYLLRWAHVPITGGALGNWDDPSLVFPVTIDLFPNIPGFQETFETGEIPLGHGQGVYIALKSVNDAGLESALSNVAYLLPDLAPPDAVGPGKLEVIAGSETTHSLLVRFEEPGDDDGGPMSGPLGSTVAGIDLRCSPSGITDDVEFNNATAVSAGIVPQGPGTVHVVTADLLQSDRTYYFAVRTWDHKFIVANWSPLSAGPVSGRTLAVPGSPGSGASRGQGCGTGACPSFAALLSVVVAGLASIRPARP